MQQPIIINPKAQEDFKQIIRDYFHENPDSMWYGGYVDYEWKHLRYILQESLPFDLENKNVLEFGCNIGASSIILSCFKANIEAVDSNKSAVDATKFNIASYGKEEYINVRHISDTTKLPFQDNHFDLILANSVLEYVCETQIDAILNELKRILKQGGVILITGTSNRIALREIHSKKLFVNYIPNFIGKFFNYKLQKGLSPWKLLTHFKQYELLELSDKSKNYLEIRKKFGWSDKKINIYRMIAFVLSYIKLTPSLLTPSLTATFRKKF